MNQILGFSQQIFINVPSNKFNGNPSSGSRDGTCKHADMMKLVRTFRDDANAPKQINTVHTELKTTMEEKIVA
jgi:hypothetical protein